MNTEELIVKFSVFDHPDAATSFIERTESAYLPIGKEVVGVYVVPFTKTDFNSTSPVEMFFNHISYSVALELLVHENVGSGLVVGTARFDMTGAAGGAVAGVMLSSESIARLET